jgi:hypothetical protein
MGIALGGGDREEGRGVGCTGIDGRGEEEEEEEKEAGRASVESGISMRCEMAEGVEIMTVMKHMARAHE